MESVDTQTSSRRWSVGGPNVIATLQTTIFFALLLLAWEFGVAYSGIKPYLLPRLSAVVKAGWIARDQLIENGWVTLGEVLIGFALAVVGGLFFGCLIYAFPLARRTLYPLATAFQVMPKSALAPLMVLWFGYGLYSKVAMSFFFAFFPILIATIGGFAGTPKNLEEHFRALHASSWTTFTTLRIPSALPVFVDGCRVALPLAVIGAIIGEFIGSQDGLGNLILLSTSSSKTDLVFATVLIVTIMSLVLYGLLEVLARLIWWRGIQI
jgi:NitT/TauT family transport system permease protein